MGFKNKEICEKILELIKADNMEEAKVLLKEEFMRNFDRDLVFDLETVAFKLADFKKYAEAVQILDMLTVHPLWTKIYNRITGDSDYIDSPLRGFGPFQIFIGRINDEARISKLFQTRSYVETKTQLIELENYDQLIGAYLMLNPTERKKIGPNLIRAIYETRLIEFHFNDTALMIFEDVQEEIAQDLANRLQKARDSTEVVSILGPYPSKFLWGWVRTKNDPDQNTTPIFIRVMELIPDEVPKICRLYLDGCMEKGIDMLSFWSSQWGDTRSKVNLKITDIVQYMGPDGKIPLLNGLLNPNEEIKHDCIAALHKFTGPKDMDVMIGALSIIRDYSKTDLEKPLPAPPKKLTRADELPSWILRWALFDFSKFDPVFEMEPEAYEKLKQVVKNLDPPYRYLVAALNPICARAIEMVHGPEGLEDLSKLINTFEKIELTSKEIEALDFLIKRMGPKAQAVIESLVFMPLRLDGRFIIECESGPSDPRSKEMEKRIPVVGYQMLHFLPLSKTENSLKKALTQDNFRTSEAINALLAYGTAESTAILIETYKQHHSKNYKRVLEKVLAEIAKSKGHRTHEEFLDEGGHQPKASASLGGDWNIGETHISVYPVQGEALITIRKGDTVLESKPKTITDTAQFKPIKEYQKAMTKELINRKNALEKSMLFGRIYSRKVFSELMMNPGFVDSATRLIFKMVTGKGGCELVIPSIDGIWMGLDGAKKKPQDVTQVQVVHPLELIKAKLLDEVQSYIIQKGIKQPFKQAFREIYEPTESERKTGDHSDRFTGLSLSSYKLFPLFRSHHWKTVANRIVRSARPDGWSVYFFWYNRDDLAKDADPYEFKISDKVYFKHEKHKTANAPLEEVPPMIFSEAMRDIDLFVSKAIRDFENYTQSDRLNNQRRMLEALIKKAGITNVTFEERYALVTGKKNKYRVNLYSGAIGLEPENKLLCVLPKIKKATSVIIPVDKDDFKSAEIIGSIQLLLNDDKIRDMRIIQKKEINSW
jgi:hypothetical protein